MFSPLTPPVVISAPPMPARAGFSGGSIRGPAFPRGGGYGCRGRVPWPVGGGGFTLARSLRWGAGFLQPYGPHSNRPRLPFPAAGPASTP
jgi:hypothetical protein